MHVDHFIWSTYGHWMPACPRESWPRYVHSWERARTGSRLADSADQSAAMEQDPYRVHKMAAEKTRRFPPVNLTPLQVQAVAAGFERCTRLRHMWIWACCIMPQYVHMLVTCPYTSAQHLTSSMRGEATKRLTELDLHPMSSWASAHEPTPLMWSHIKWHQVLKDDSSIHEAIDYVNGLPQREGSADQHWGFVREFHSLSRCREECEAYDCSAGTIPA